MVDSLHRFLRACFYSILVRPTLALCADLSVSGRSNLAGERGMIVVANHNSHFDAMALVLSIGVRRLRRVRLAGAEDYFFATAVMAWFSQNILGIVPVRRGSPSGGNPLAVLHDCLERGQIVVFFPEGTRGRAGELGRFKRGIELLARAHPDVPIVPVRLDGLDRVLPRGALLPRRHPSFAEARAPLHGRHFRSGLGEALRARLSRPIADYAAAASMPVLGSTTHERIH